MRWRVGLIKARVVPLTHELLQNGWEAWERNVGGHASCAQAESTFVISNITVTCL